jgi:hypothetical protein
VAPCLAGQRVLIRNDHATDKLIIGASSSLTATTGFAIPAGTSLDLGTLLAGEGLWAVRAGTNDIAAQVLVLSS